MSKRFIIGTRIEALKCCPGAWDIKKGDKGILCGMSYSDNARTQSWNYEIIFDDDRRRQMWPGFLKVIK